MLFHLIANEQINLMYKCILKKQALDKFDVYKKKQAVNNLFPTIFLSLNIIFLTVELICKCTGFTL